MILRRAEEGAVKCAFLDLRRLLLTEVEYFILACRLHVRRAPKRGLVDGARFGKEGLEFRLVFAGCPTEYFCGRMSNRPMWVYSLSCFIHVVLSVLTHSCCYARPFARRHFRSSNRIYDMSGASRRIEVLRDHVAPADDEVRARKIRPSHARTSVQRAVGCCLLSQ